MGSSEGEEKFIKNKISRNKKGVSVNIIYELLHNSYIYHQI